VKDKTSDKKPGSTELDDKALDGVVGGCIPGGPSPITIKGTGGTGGTGPTVEGGGGTIKEPSAPIDPVTIRFPTK
jgi:hypothetical protein